MTDNLKTLRDLESPIKDFKGCDINYTKVIDIRELRAEAIKWVKEFRKLNGNTSIGKFGKNTSAGVCYGFIQFFNLTEEELK
jgi:hypothetical protein